MNVVLLTGRLTDEPKITSLQTSTRANFTIAIDRDEKPKGENKEKTTDFIPCVAWATSAEYIGKWAKKGSLVELEGSINVNKYEVENEDGSKTIKSITIVNVKKVKVHGTLSRVSSEDKSSETSSAKKSNKTNDAQYDGDDLPF